MKAYRNLWTNTATSAAAALVLGLAASAAQALPTINLTSATFNGTKVATVNAVSGTVGDVITTDKGSVIFARDTTQPAGTGVFNPFLRLDCKGNGCDEQGYNTNGVKGDASNNYTTRKILDNVSPVNWTHDVKLADLELVTLQGSDYYRFKLDINEPGNTNSLLSLDGLKLYSTSDAAQYGQTLGTNVLTGIAGEWIGPTSSTLLWDLDGTPLTGSGSNATYDRSILLDATVSGGPGSGIADMLMLVSRSVIDKAIGNGQANLILWSRFGLEQGAKADTGATTADAGFEEWAYSTKSGTPTNGGGGGGVPAPGTAALAMLGLAILGMKRRAGNAMGTAA